MKSLHQFVLLFCFCLPIGLLAQSVEGTWKTMIADQEGNPVPLQVTINSGGTYSVDIAGDGNVDINGKYELNDGKMTVQDTGGPEACNGKGVYSIEVTEKTLKMTRVSDECPNRGGPEGVMNFTKV